jgi:hypothetical protein
MWTDTVARRPLVAEDCLLAQLIEGLLWRKPTLKSHFSAAESDPQQTSDGSYSDNPTASRFALSRLWESDLKLFAQLTALKVQKLPATTSLMLL